MRWSFRLDTRKSLGERRTSQGDRSNSDAHRRSLASISHSKQKRSASVIVRRNNRMQLPEFTRSTTLRWTFLVAGSFAAFIVALLGFVYLKTKDDLTMRSDRLMASQIGFFAQLPPEGQLGALCGHV